MSHDGHAVPHREHTCAPGTIGWLALSVLLSVASLCSADGGAITIEHRPAGCALAGAFTRLTACVAPTDGVATPRLYFRTQGDTAWYFVDMATTSAGCSEALLPKPLPRSRGIEYYIHAQSLAPPLVEGQTPVYLAEVRLAREGCATPFEARGTLNVRPAEGQVRAPAGFATDGIAGLSKTTRHIGAATVVVGGAVGISALTAGVAAVSKAQPAASPTTPSSGTATPTSTPSPTPNGDATATATPTPRSGTTATATATTVAATATPTPSPTSTPTPGLLPTLPPILSHATGSPRMDARDARTLACRSRLTGTGARVQLVLDGQVLTIPAGESLLRATGRPGANEAAITQSDGGPAFLRLDCSATRDISAVRPLAGEAAVDGTAVVLVHLRGRGDRASFSFALD